MSPNTYRWLRGVALGVIIGSHLATLDAAAMWPMRFGSIAFLAVMFVLKPKVSP